MEMSMDAVLALLVLTMKLTSCVAADNITHNPCNNDETFYEDGGQCIQIAYSEFDAFQDYKGHLKKCRNENSELVSIYSSAKQEYLMSLINETAAPTVPYLIGLKFDFHKKLWAWNSGIKSNYSNFLDKDFSLSTSSNQPGFGCVALDPSTDNMAWKPVHCESPYSGRICERHLCFNGGGCEQICSVINSKVVCDCEKGFWLVDATHCEKELDLCGDNYGGCASKVCRTENGMKVCGPCPDGEMCEEKGTHDSEDDEMEDFLIPGITVACVLLAFIVAIIVRKRRNSGRRGEVAEEKTPEKEFSVTITKDPDPYSEYPRYDPVIGSPI